jgi:hypothetical protein
VVVGADLGARAAIVLADVGAAVLSDHRARPREERTTCCRTTASSSSPTVTAMPCRPGAGPNFGVFTSAEYPQIVLHGRIAGSWRREVTSTQVRATLRPYLAVSKSDTRALTQQAARLGRFFGRPSVAPVERAFRISG